MVRVHFRSRKDPLFGVVILGAALTMLIVFVDAVVRDESFGDEDRVWGFTILIIATGFLLWLWFDTRYYIDQGLVYYRSGPFRGKIQVSSIREVVVNTTMWAGFKPALARNGVIVKYNQYDDIYFSPNDNEAFIKALCDVKPQIHIIRK